MRLNIRIAAEADIRFPEMLAPDQSVALNLIVNKVASISRIAAPAAGQVQSFTLILYCGQSDGKIIDKRH